MQLFDNSKNYFDIFLKDNEVRPLILILPGGAYNYTSERESIPVSNVFLKNGFHTAILYYRETLLPHPQPLYDLAKCIKEILSMNLPISEIILLGFSAGGHLAATYGCFYQNEQIMKDFFIKNFELKRIILCYPVITSNDLYSHKLSFETLDPKKEYNNLLSLENQVPSYFPKTFIWHTLTDNSVPVENTFLFVNALKEKNINFELHIFPLGGHGLSLANEETSKTPDQNIPYIQCWTDMVIKWINEI